MRLNLSRAEPRRWSTCAACSARRSTRRPPGAGATPVAALLDGKGTARARPAGRPRAAGPMTIGELMAEHGSPLWLVDLDRVRTRLREFRAAWTRRVARRRGRLLLQDQPAAGHPARAGRRGRRRTRSCARPSTRWRATRSARAGPDVIVNGPVKPDALLERAASRRRPGRRRLRARARRAPRAPASSASACASRCPGIGVEPTRFGIAPGDWCPTAAARARALGLDARGAERAPRLHRLRAAARPAPRAWAPRSPCSGRPRPTRHAAAADAPGAPGRRPRRRRDRPRRRLPGRAGRRPRTPRPSRTPCAPHGFAGRLILEPGRALVTDAVALAFTVVAVKQLDDGTRCVVVDAGTNLLPGALWSWPRIEARRRARERPDDAGARQRAAVPERRRPAPGRAAARARAPATPCSCATPAPTSRRNRRASATCGPRCVAHDDGRWRLCQRRETLDDLLAGDHRRGRSPAPAPEEDGHDRTAHRHRRRGRRHLRRDHRQAREPRPEGLALHRVRGHRLLARAGSPSSTAARSRASRTSSSRPSSATSSDGLDMRMETVVTDIDLDRGTITARNQHEGFDKLIVATGFVWEKPDVPGANLEGLHYVKNIRKAMEFDKVLETVKTRRRGRRHAARRRDGGQPRPARPRGRTSSTRARGCCTRCSTPTSPSPSTSR